MQIAFKPMPRYIIKTAGESMPARCKGTYRKVAVLELDPTHTDVAMISERARGVVRIVHLERKLNVGLTDKCAYERALAFARDLIQDLERAARRAYRKRARRYVARTLACRPGLPAARLPAGTL